MLLSEFYELAKVNFGIQWIFGLIAAYLKTEMFLDLVGE